MAFNKFEWVNRVSQYPTRRKIQDTETLEEKIIDVYREEGEVLHEGTALNSENLNNLEDRIGDMFPVSIEDGGTGANTSEDAVVNLGLADSETKYFDASSPDDWLNQVKAHALSLAGFKKVTSFNCTYNGRWHATAFTWKTSEEITYLHIICEHVGEYKYYYWDGTWRNMHARGTFNLELIDYHGTHASITPYQQNNIYVKQGELCYVSFWVRFTVNDPGTGYIRFQGLPFKSLKAGAAGQALAVSAMQGNSLGDVSKQNGTITIPDYTNWIDIMTLSGETSKQFVSTGDTIIGGSGHYITEFE